MWFFGGGNEERDAGGEMGDGEMGRREETGERGEGRGERG